MRYFYTFYSLDVSLAAKQYVASYLASHSPVENGICASILTTFPVASMYLSGENFSGCGKYAGSCMMAVWFAKTLVLAGMLNPLNTVASVVK